MFFSSLEIWFEYILEFSQLISKSENFCWEKVVNHPPFTLFSSLTSFSHFIPYQTLWLLWRECMPGLIFKAFFHCLCVVKNQHVKWFRSLRAERGSRKQRCRSSALFFSYIPIGSPSICWDSVSPKRVPEAFTVCCCSRAASFQGFISNRFDHSLFMKQHSLCW